MECWVFMPDDTPIINQKECLLHGANVYAVDGLIDDCGKIVREGMSEMGWFDVSTLKEPYRIEGKKTMGLELAEQLDWNLPDVILYPTGGGTGLIGMWKAFAELASIGWLETDQLPRMVSVQSDGCAPIARAFDEGERFAELFENAASLASGIRVPAAVGESPQHPGHARPADHLTGVFQPVVVLGPDDARHLGGSGHQQRRGLEAPLGSARLYWRAIRPASIAP